MSALQLAAAALPILCPVAETRVTVRVDGVGWIEEVHALVRPGEGAPCEAVAIPLADGVRLEAWSGRVSAFRRPDHPLDPARLRLWPDPAGGTVATVLLAELEAGDEARLTWTRRWTRPKDWRWLPDGSSGPGFVEVSGPRGIEGRADGFRTDRRGWWSDAPAQHTLTLVHPWAGREPVPHPATSERGLSASEALTRIGGLRFVPDAALGAEPVAGDEALRLGFADRRGVARTLVALTEGGADEVVLARPVGPAAGLALAAELAVVRTPEGPAFLRHPDDGAEHAATYATPWGPLHVEPAPSAALRSDAFTGSTEVRIAVSGRDPLSEIAAGGTLTWEETLTLDFTSDGAPGRASAAWLALDGVRSMRVLDTACHARVDRTEGVWVVAPVGTTTCRLTLVRTLRDAWDTLTLSGSSAEGSASWSDPWGYNDSGSLALEPDAWRLGALAQSVLLADPARRWREWQRRFLAASFPEPGLPLKERAGLEGWAFAAELRRFVTDRLHIRDDLDVRPMAPRPLHGVRRSGVASPEEAALIAALYARQERLQADVVLVDPHRTWPITTLAPTGFSEALLRIRHEGAEAWIDLRCTSCEPFEIRASLRGRPAIGPDGLDRVPEAQP